MMRPMKRQASILKLLRDEQASTIPLPFETSILSCGGETNLSHGTQRRTPRSGKRHLQPVISLSQKGVGSRVGIDAEAASKCVGGLETQRIYQGNFLELAGKLPDQSVDIIIADPPYNASKGNALSLESGILAGMGGSWQKIAQVWDDMSFDDYFAFTINWLKEAKRLLKKTGSMWVHGTYHSAGITNVAMQMLGVEIINEVVWYKRNSFPNLAGRRLTASHETILWAHRGGKRGYRFNYEHSKSGDFSDDDLKAPGKQMRTVWDLPNNKPRYEQAHGKHPAQKPVRLARRFIQLSAQPGDLCVVPFAGSGTECVAAKEEGLHYIGFDTDPTYVDIARARLNDGSRK